MVRGRLEVFLGRAGRCQSNYCSQETSRGVLLTPSAGPWLRATAKLVGAPHRARRAPARQAAIERSPAPRRTSGGRLRSQSRAGIVTAVCVCACSRLACLLMPCRWDWCVSCSLRRWCWRCCARAG